MDSKNRNMFRVSKPFLLPLSVAIFPAIFFYGNNSRLLLLSSLLRAVAFYVLLAMAIYFLFLIVTKEAVQSANSAFVFFVFFHTYGVVFDYFLKLDIFQVEHYMILPLFLLIGLYSSWLVNKINSLYSINIWNSLTFAVSVLVVFNIIKIIPVEVGKMQKLNVDSPIITPSKLPSQHSPDIYYIVFDEFSGFEPMRKYWHNQKVNDFVEFLEANSFFVAEQSHSSSLISLHQMATRLNYEDYPCCEYEKYLEIYYDHVSDNKVMRYLKSKGYSTVVFEELTIPKAFPAMSPIIADYSFNDISDEDIFSSDSSRLFDEFGLLVANNSMLRVFPISHEDSYSGHRDKILFTASKVGEVKQISSPKFVYVHLLLPHLPFMFDEEGNVLDAELHENWNYYLGQYNYSITIAEKMIDDILSNADLENRPVIILQSDHGARNIDYGSATLDNYPEEYKTSILFALYMPGYDTASIPQNIDPINTFPIVFNYLFDDHIPLK